MKEKTYYNGSRLEILPFVPENIKTILDIGCGLGNFLKLVKEKTGAETWGVEIANEIAVKAKTNVDRIIVGNVEDVLNKITDNYFDCITFNDSLEHLVNPMDILKKVSTKLSFNGCIVASIPNVRYIYNIYELLCKKDWKYKDAGILDKTHLRFFTKKSMNYLFENSGYILEKQIGINKIHPIKMFPLNIITFGFAKDMQYLQFVCIARKK